MRGDPSALQHCGLPREILNDSAAGPTGGLRLRGLHLQLLISRTVARLAQEVGRDGTTDSEPWWDIPLLRDAQGPRVFSGGVLPDLPESPPC